MPEPNFLSMYSFTPEPPKKCPIIKLSCGIGDTDGFPAFDVDSEQYAAKDDSKWGFLITGGAEFHMPLTVFQVTPDGLADKGGICLGDILLQINEEDATQLTLSQAHDKISASGKKIHFLVKSMDDEELMEGYEPGEERSIVLRVPKPPPPPKVSAIEKRLQELQRKLTEIAEIPKILCSTLATVSQTFDKLTTATPSPLSLTPPPPDCQQQTETEHDDYFCHFEDNEQKRKLSYDEDVYDYELSDDDDNEDKDGIADKEANENEFDAEQAYLQLKRYAANRQNKSKDITPESDYASEINYQQNEFETELSSNDDKDNNVICNNNDEDDNDEYEEFNLSALKTAFSEMNSDSDTEVFDDDTHLNEKVSEIDTDTETEDEDFLTTTFTWNLRNKSKLHQENVEANDNNFNLLKHWDNVAANAEQAQHKKFNEAEEILSQHLNGQNEVPPEKEQKLDKVERSWPWADREKIIYKQSTCHLVPYKPLGLIEQRIQLLKKRNLLEHIHKIKNPQ